MATTNETRRGGVGARPLRASTETDGDDRLSVEVTDDLAVSVHAGVERDAADDADLEKDDEASASHLGKEDAAASHLGEDDDADTSGFAAHAVDLDGDEPPSDAPLGLTAVRLPARGRRRGRPGTIF
jgi:hypothetical protein